jgi:hypothetical protein
MVLSELTNKELKSILRENDVRNYSKLNKKNLVKKVNQLIKAQNGGGKKSGKGKNKKYTLRELIGGTLLTDKNGKPIYSPPLNSPGGQDNPKLNANPQLTPQGDTTQGANTASQGALPPASALPSASAPPLINSSKGVVEQTAISRNGQNNAARARGDPLPPPRLAYRQDGSIDDPKQLQQAPIPYNPYLNPPQRVTNINKNKPKDECGPCSIQ